MFVVFNYSWNTFLLRTDQKRFRVCVLRVATCSCLTAAYCCVVEGYFWAYDSASGQCDLRSMASSRTMSKFWSVWSWTTEMFIFLAVPVAALFFNVFVINEVRRLSKSPPSSTTASRRSTRRLSSRSLGSKSHSPRSRVDSTPVAAGSGSSGTSCTATTVMLLSDNAPVIANGRSNSRSRSVTSTGVSRSSMTTTVMLLSVSFYVIATTLPATLVYVLETEFPEGDHALSDLDIAQDATWTRYQGYILSRKVVEEICLSHYACNIVLYLVTGAHFRRALLELLGCRKRRQYCSEYSEVTVRATTPCTTAV